MKPTTKGWKRLPKIAQWQVLFRLANEIRMRSRRLSGKAPVPHGFHPVEARRILATDRAVFAALASMTDPAVVRDAKELA